MINKSENPQTVDFFAYINQTAYNYFYFLELDNMK